MSGLKHYEVKSVEYRIVFYGYATESGGCDDSKAESEGGMLGRGKRASQGAFGTPWSRPGHMWIVWHSAVTP